MGMRIAIIGAGLTGLVAARRLAGDGHAVRLFDKGRGPGGRLSTRRIDGATVDHGAPELHGADGTGTAAGGDGAEGHTGLARWMEAARGVETPHGWIGVPTMSAVGKALADGLDLTPGVEVAEIARDGESWRLDDLSGAVHGPFDRVIVTAPAPQAARLTGLDLSPARMVPQWTGILAFAAPLDAPDRILGGDVALALRMAARPGRAAAEAWAVHMDPDWSEARVERERPEMAPVILDALAELVGPLPEATHAAAHRWRFARTATPLGRPFAQDPTGTLLAGGDWALGPHAGHAVASGTAMADAVLRGPGAGG